jgi:hypothetical protein
MEDPDCVVCANFVHRGVRNVRDPNSQSGCRLHRIELPLAATDRLLICRDWENFRTRKPLVGWPKEFLYKPGVLYTYAYSGGTNLDLIEFAQISDQPALNWQQESNDG